MDWTKFSRTIGEHSTKWANEPDKFVIKQPRKVDIPLNKESKVKTILLSFNLADTLTTDRSWPASNLQEMCNSTLLWALRLELSLQDTA